ncbi:unnamed protein product [Prunus brigantina]
MSVGECRAAYVRVYSLVQYYSYARVHSKILLLQAMVPGQKVFWTQLNN